MGSRLDRLVDVVNLLAGVSAVGLAAVLGFRALGSSASAGEIDSILVEEWESYSQVGWRTGASDPLVTVVEFGDYQCPYCRQAEPHIQAILRRHPTEVAFVYRHFPLPSHSLAVVAAEAAECAGAAGDFWSVHHALLGTSGWLESGEIASFVTLAVEAGVDDAEAFESCLRDSEHAAEVARDVAAGRRLGVRGTPTFLVNERLHVGPLDSLQFDAILEDVRRGSGL